MRTLIFDSTADELFVAYSDGKVYYGKRERAVGTENLLPLVDKVLKKCNAKINDVEVVAFNVGPGSWTGCRVAVVTAFGLKAGNFELKLLPFSTFDLISYNVMEQSDFVMIVKGYSNFVYIKTNLGEPKCVSVDEFEEQFSKYRAYGIEKVLKKTKVVKADYLKVVEKKIEQKCFKEVCDIEPMYLRQSQAEINLLKKKASDDKKSNR